MISANHDRRRYWATGLGPALAAQGRKQTWLAIQLGRSPALVTHVLKGRRALGSELAGRAAALLGRPLDELFREEMTRPRVSHATAEQATTGAAQRGRRARSSG